MFRSFLSSFLSVVSVSSVFMGFTAVVGAQLASSPFGGLKAQAEARQTARHEIVVPDEMAGVITPDTELSEMRFFFTEEELQENTVVAQR